MSTPTAKGRATRERIVRATAELVAERGVAAVTLDDVGRRAHASRSQLYHYFDDKTDLVPAVVTRPLEPSSAPTTACSRPRPWAGSTGWFDALVELQRERRAQGGSPDRLTRRSAGRARPGRPSRDRRGPRPLGDAPAQRPHTHARPRKTRARRRSRETRHDHNGRPPRRPTAHPSPPRPPTATNRARRRPHRPPQRPRHITPHSRNDRCWARARARRLARPLSLFRQRRSDRNRDARLHSFRPDVTGGRSV